MLEPILDPFDRPAGHACRECDQHDIGEDALLDPEAAAGIGRRAQPQAIARHLERARDDRVNAEGALEIGRHVIGVEAGVVFRDHAIGLDRRAGVARIIHLDREPVRCRREGAFRIAVAEGALAREVAAEARMQHRRLRRQGRTRIDDGGERPVVGLDEIERVLRHIAVACHHQCYGLADIAHPVGGDRPAFDRRLDADDEAGAYRLHFRAREHGGDAGQGPRARRIDGGDLGMGMGRAQDRGMERAGRDAEIVDEAAAPGQECCILHARERTPDPGCALHALSPPRRSGARSGARGWPSAAGSGHGLGHRASRAFRSGSGKLPRSCRSVSLPRFARPPVRAGG